MILKGNTRTGAAALVNHLMNERDNDHVEVHALDGFASPTFEDSLFETEAIAKGTNCKKPFFSLSLNPPAYASVSEHDFEDAINKAGDALGLAEQPRAVIFHEKEGRRHCHVVWSRIDPENMKAISDSFTRYKLQEVSRELFLQHGWDLPKGLERDERGNANNTTRAEQEIAKRSGLNIDDHNTLISQAWSLSDSAKSFALALEDQGYILAHGKRGFIAIDVYTSDAHSIPRRLGLKKAAVEAKIGKPTALPSIDEARPVAGDRRQAIQETLKHEKPKASKAKPAGQKALEDLKQIQRQERVDLISKQKTAQKVQERSFVQKLFGDMQSIWNASAANLARLRDTWIGAENNQKAAKDILIARQTQTKAHQHERDCIRQIHLQARRALQPGLLKQRNSDREKIIFERRRLVQDKDLDRRKATIRDKLIQDRLKSRDHDR